MTSKGTVDELEAVKELHALLQLEEGVGQQRLLTTGFIPQGEVALIHAGVLCLPFLDDNLAGMTHDAPLAATKRLVAIATRLDLLGESDAARRAVLEFRSAMQNYRQGKRRSILLGCGVLLAIPVVIALLIWWYLG